MPSVDEAVAQIMASRYQPRVGDRVRVTAAIAECRAVPDPGTPADRKGTLGHADWQLGLTGWVSEIGCPPDDAPDHVVLVWWDQHPKETTAGGCCYVPTELELLEPADEERRMQGREGE